MTFLLKLRSIIAKILLMNDKLFVVLVTCPIDNAEELAETLVKERLAACINIIPVKSIYSWQGKLDRDDESLLILKSKQSAYEKLESRIKEIHPYDIPEIVALESEKVETAYLNWVIDSVQSG